VVPVPRAALLVCWGNAWLRGQVPIDDVVAATRGSDEPHQVHDAGAATAVLPPSADRLDPLAELLLGWRAAGLRGLRLALPAAGDPLGLSGPPALTAQVIDVGEAVLTIGLSARAGVEAALVPQVSRFGPPGDEGAMVVWQVLDASARRPDVPRLREADRAFADVVRQAAGTLERLDVADWRGDGGGRVATPTVVRTPTFPLPPDTDPRVADLVTRAAAVRQVVEVALADDGGALTAYGAAQRRASLEPLDAAARRAIVAAVGAAVERDW
jgi:hypothetical protein